MATISVIELNQSKPSRTVKRSIAELLVRRLLAEWESRKVIRMLSVHDPLPSLPVKSSNPLPHKPYIPAKLPPKELPGLRFDDPMAKVCPKQPRRIAIRHS